MMKDEATYYVLNQILEVLKEINSKLVFQDPSCVELNKELQAVGDWRQDQLDEN